jgi:hypothetical protein
MTKTYIFWIILAVAGITSYNVLLAQRDIKMFEAYDQACAALPQPHPDCRYAK